MAMPQCCYLATGAKRPSHTTNTMKIDRILFDPCNSIKRFDLCPFEQKNSTYLQPATSRDLLRNGPDDSNEIGSKLACIQKQLTEQQLSENKLENTVQKIHPSEVEERIPDFEIGEKNQFSHRKTAADS